MVLLANLSATHIEFSDQEFVSENNFFLHNVQESFGVEFKTPGYPNQSDSAIFTSVEFACSANIVSWKTVTFIIFSKYHTGTYLYVQWSKGLDYEFQVNQHY